MVGRERFGRERLGVSGLGVSMAQRVGVTSTFFQTCRLLPLPLPPAAVRLCPQQLERSETYPDFVTRMKSLTGVHA